jgi:hypothetical protein
MQHMAHGEATVCGSCAQEEKKGRGAAKALEAVPRTSKGMIDTQPPRGRLPAQPLQLALSQACPTRASDSRRLLRRLPATSYRYARLLP